MQLSDWFIFALALFDVLSFGMMLLLSRAIVEIDRRLRESEDLLDFRLSALEDLHITDAELSQFISYESRIAALEAKLAEADPSMKKTGSPVITVEESTVKTTQE